MYYIDNAPKLSFSPYYFRKRKNSICYPSNGHLLKLVYFEKDFIQRNVPQLTNFDRQLILKTDHLFLIFC